MKKENDDCHWKNLGIPTIEKKISKEDHPKVEIDSEFLEQVNKLSLTPTKPSSPVIPQPQLIETVKCTAKNLKCDSVLVISK